MKEEDIHFESQSTTITCHSERCPVCNGHCTVNYGKQTCKVCSGKGYIIVPNSIKDL